MYFQKPNQLQNCGAVGVFEGGWGGNIIKK